MHSTSFSQSLPPRRGPRSQSGFTIMEVALASFVMALGLCTSIVAMQAGYKFLDLARDTTLASQILQSEIERIRMMAWGTTGTDGVSGLATGTQPQNVSLSSMFAVASGEGAPTAEQAFAAILERRFRVTRTVTLDSTRPAGAGVAVITVNVAWTSIDGRSHSRQFQAKYAQQGLYDYFYTNANRAPRP